MVGWPLIPGSVRPVPVIVPGIGPQHRPQMTLAVDQQPVSTPGPYLLGAGNYVTLCDLGVFADQAAEPVPAQNTHSGHFGSRMRALGGPFLLQCPVWPVRVVVIDIFAQDQPQVSFAGDQHPVQALAAGAAHPTFRDRVSHEAPGQASG
jgi:hypothetical protein